MSRWCLFLALLLAGPESVYSLVLRSLQSHSRFNQHGQHVPGQPRTLSRRIQSLPEHLIDCASNPMLADLYGGPESPYCFQQEVGPLAFLGSTLEQTFTIGFMVAAYFFFRRTRGGVRDWMETQVDADEEEAEDAFFDDLRRGAAEGELSDAFLREDRRRVTRSGPSSSVSSEGSSEPQRCPQCNGLGKFSWGGADGGRYAPCELCLGAGSIVVRNRGPRARSSPRGLPSRSSSGSSFTTSSSGDGRDGDEE